MEINIFFLFMKMKNKKKLMALKWSKPWRRSDEKKMSRLILFLKRVNYTFI